LKDTTIRCIKDTATKYTPYLPLV